MNLITNRNYILLRSGWSISSLGSQLQSFAFSLYVLASTGSAAQFSITLCMQFVPMILFAPFSGYVSDRFDRKKQIVCYDLLSGATVLLFLLLYLLHGSLKVYEIYLCVFALSAFQTFFSSVAGCLIQAVVEPRDYTKQKSVDTTISSLISIFAPALAGVLYAFAGIYLILLLNAASFLFSAGMELFLRLPKTNAQAAASKDVSFFASLAEGFRYIRRSPFIISFLLTLSILNFILPSVEIGLMTVSQKLMRLNAATIGIENSILSVGMLAAAILCGLFGKKLEKIPVRRLISRSVIIDSLAFFLISLWLRFAYGSLAAAANVGIFCMLNLVFVLATTVISISLNSQFQRQVPNELMGRAGAFVNAVLTACVPLGQVTAGLLMGGAPYFAAYLIEGILCLILLGINFKRADKSAIINNKAGLNPHTALETEVGSFEKAYTEQK